MNSFYRPEELKKIGFKSIGENVLISKNTTIYGAEQMVVGSNVRVDDFCVLSGKINLGDYTHVAAYCCLFGGDKGITMEDFAGLSSRCAVYAVSDDYSGKAMTNPMVPIKYRNVFGKEVVLKKHTIIGSGTTILPGVTIGIGASVGSMSLVTNEIAPWGIYIGIPCRRIKERSQNILELEQAFMNEKNK